MSWLETMAADLTSAVRVLRATPAFSVAAVTMLAVGIGVNVAVFTVVGATLFKGYRGVPDNDRLVYVTTGRDCCLSRLDLDDWRAASTLTGPQRQRTLASALVGLTGAVMVDPRRRRGATCEHRDLAAAVLVHDNRERHTCVRNGGAQPQRWW